MVQSVGSRRRGRPRAASRLLPVGSLLETEAVREEHLASRIVDWRKHLRVLVALLRRSWGLGGGAALHCCCCPGPGIQVSWTWAQNPEGQRGCWLGQDCLLSLQQLQSGFGCCLCRQLLPWVKKHRVDGTERCPSLLQSPLLTEHSGKVESQSQHPQRHMIRVSLKQRGREAVAYWLAHI